MSEIEKIIARGAEIFAEIEKDQFKAEKLADELEELHRKAHEIGFGGYVNGNARAARAKEIVVRARREIFELHRQIIDDAEKLGLELPEIESSGGGGR